MIPRQRAVARDLGTKAKTIASDCAVTPQAAIENCGTASQGTHTELQMNLPTRSSYTLQRSSKVLFLSCARTTAAPDFGKTTEQPPRTLKRNLKASTAICAVARTVRPKFYCGFRWRLPKPLPIHFLLPTSLNSSTSDHKGEFGVALRVAWLAEASTRPVYIVHMPIHAKLDYRMPGTVRKST